MQQSGQSKWNDPENACLATIRACGVGADRVFRVRERMTLFWHNHFVSSRARR
jgi:uncharacterized protein (DUF1800 family)